MKRLGDRKQTKPKTQPKPAIRLAELMMQYAGELVTGANCSREEMHFKLEAYAFELGQSRVDSRKQADAVLALSEQNFTPA